MKFDYKYIILIITLSFFTFNMHVMADINVAVESIAKIDDQTVYRMYDELVTGETNVIGSKANILLLEIDGKRYVAYCIEFEVHYVSGSNAQTYDLYEYFGSVIGPDEAKELIKKITLYAKYGYAFNGKNDDKYYLATQQLIWEAINATGFYQSEFYKGRLGQNINIMNLGWTIDKKNKIDISKEINEVKNEVYKHDITPSFCNNNNKLEIELGETVTYTDKNNVLSLYKTICDDDLKCIQKENKLTITAQNNTGNKNIQFIKEATGTENVLYRIEEYQSIISNTGLVEPVTCNFGINSYQNVQTSDTKIIYISIVGLFCGCIAYIIYKTKHI